MAAGSSAEQSEHPPGSVGRICVAIPHYCRPSQEAGLGSERTQPAARAAALQRCLYSLHHHFGWRQRFLTGLPPCNEPPRQLQIFVCTRGEDHVLDRVRPGLCHHVSAECEPRMLGYVCHQVLAERTDDFDHFVYLEDDILVSDPALFLKLQWFSSLFGDEALLQPQRFEAGDVNGPIKLYIDGALNPPHTTDRYQDVGRDSVLSAEAFGRRLRFHRPQNPHAGCFFLNRRQMRTLSEQPYFLDRSDAWVGPLESAATLAIMKTFRIYKPVLENAAFLEVEHLDHRHLNV